MQHLLTYLMRKRVILCGFLVASLVILQGYALPVYASSTSSRDPKVLSVIDTTHAARHSCTLTSVTHTHAGLQSTNTIPCPDGSTWQAKVVHRSQALALHESYVILPDQATPGMITQLAMQLENQQKARSRFQAFLPLSTGCDTTTTQYQTWSFDTDWQLVNLTSRVQYYVLPSPNCDKVVFEAAGLHINSFTFTLPNSGAEGEDWQYDKYAGTVYNVPNSWHFDAAGQDHWHGINAATQPKGYTYETWVGTTSCVDCEQNWNDIPVN